MILDHTDRHVIEGLAVDWFNGFLKVEHLVNQPTIVQDRVIAATNLTTFESPFITDIDYRTNLKQLTLQGIVDES